MAIKVRPSFDSRAFLAKVGEGESVRNYRENEVVFSQGDPADAVFYVKRGKVKVTVVSERGKEAVVALLGPEDFIGEGCLAGQPRRMATVVTMTDSVIARLGKSAIIRLIHEDPAFSEMFMAHLWRGPSASKRIWSISCLIQARNVLPGCFCCLRTLARRANRSR